MFDKLVLLADEAEQTYLSRSLTRWNGDLDIIPVATGPSLTRLAPNVLARARLIAFATPVVVPAPILDALGYGAYNFHPGPPEYRGWYPHCFAVYENAAHFGVTAHAMARRVDSGPIVGLERFDIPPGSDAGALGEQVYAALLALFARLAQPLAAEAGPLPHMSAQWGPRITTRRDFAAMCRISFDMRPEEIRRRIRAFGSGDGISRPGIELHGHHFTYAAQDAAQG